MLDIEISQPIRELERDGATFTVINGTIRVSNPAGLRPELLAELRRRKKEALEYFAQRDRVSMPPDDPYSARLRRVLLSTCTADYPAGLIPWLDTTHPGLHAALTETLPNEIHRLWSAGASIAEFDEVLAEWLDTHHRAVASYCAENAGAR